MFLTRVLRTPGFLNVLRKNVREFSREVNNNKGFVTIIGTLFSGGAIGVNEAYNRINEERNEGYKTSLVYRSTVITAYATLGTVLSPTLVPLVIYDKVSKVYENIKTNL
jgi:hypothetical protein